MLNDLEIVLLKEMAAINALSISRAKRFDKLALRMRQACPVPGEEWDKFMTVLLQPGEEIKIHAHKRHAILYYPEAVSKIVIDQVVIYPARDTLIYIRPGKLHSVLPSIRPRLSVAMLVSDVPLEV